MGERMVELQGVLSQVRRRWTLLTGLRAWGLGAGAATAVLAAGLAAIALGAPDGLPLLMTVVLVSSLAVAGLVWAAFQLRTRPSDARLARLVEERTGGLDDVLVTAVDYAARPATRDADDAGDLREALAADALRAVRGLDLDRVIDVSAVRRAAAGALAATFGLGIVLLPLAPAFTRAGSLASAFLFPDRIVIEVTPGSARVKAGEPLVVTARIEGHGELVPTITVGEGPQARSLDMRREGPGGAYAVTLSNITAPFPYHVTAGGARSDVFGVEVIRPARVERIDLRYEYPKGSGLAPRTEEDSGDIYAPAGTTVRLMITADKPIERAILTMADGTAVPLQGGEGVLDGALTVSKDGSYRVALRDRDGLENPGETEYFIRTLADRPPTVRVERPASDRQVTPLEEVLIEASAEDDHGIASLELVVQAPGRKERVVRLPSSSDSASARGFHTLFLEDLGVAPGDFVTYYARARDVNRGRPSAEARSDIFFLEVKPFDGEFVAAQSQAMGGGSPQTPLAEAQKEIIIATWKLDARRKRGGDAASEADVKAVAQAQRELKTKAEQMSGLGMRTLGQPRRRPQRGATAPTADPMGRAIDAMGRAAGELDRVSTGGALPHEMEALNQLLKAESESRRQQVGQQSASGSGGQNRSGPDLSTLFDQELRKRQSTNYETPTSSETRPEPEAQEDPLARIRELARRQESLNREQEALARQQLEEEALKRELARLSREQNQLRQQAEELSRQMQQPQGARPQPRNGDRSAGTGRSQQLREASEAMRSAATGMGRENTQQASQGGARALERLRDLERQMEAAGPDDRRRALGDLQLETRQLADAQRRLSNEAQRVPDSSAGADARRRLAGEQDRLAERAERLKSAVRDLAREGNERGETAQAGERGLDTAAREIERQRISERMRENAGTLRDGAPGAPQRQAGATDDVARALDRVAEQLGAAGGGNPDTQRLSEQLSRTQELRDRIDAIDQSLQQLQRGTQNPEPSGQPRAEAGAEGQQGTQGRAQGGNAQSPAPGRDGDVSALQRALAEQMREAQQLSDELRRQNPGMQSGPGSTPEGWMPSVTSPGTEAFKQDFARWESLKQNLLLALERTESDLSDELRARESRERLNAGRHDAVPERYREQVEQYYRSLAAPRKPRQ